MSEEAVSQYVSEQGTAAQAKPSLPLAAWIAIAIAAFVVGLVIGSFALGGGLGKSGGFDGPAVANESQLDAPVASYSYKGEKVTLTVREVLESGTSLDAAKDADGNYRLPAAGTVLDYARNQVLVAEAKSRGIALTEDEVASYALDSFGSDDFFVLAQSYSMSEEALKSSLEASATIDRLHTTVASEESSDSETSWSDYVNEIYAKASITIYELVS